MKRVRWLSGLFLAGMLCVMLGTIGAQVAQAQRPIHILDLQCLVTKGTLAVGGRNSGGLADLYKGPTDISIGRQLYTSIMTVRQASWTCKLPGGRASLRLEYGVDDRDEISPPKIEVYVDGNQVASQVGKPGRINTMLADISNGKSLALEISCSTAKNCDRRPYHFFKFQIEPGASSPGSR
ncbi:hypothetical protein [Microcoleus sp. D2_18a_D3]|uniref:hypothetical protein n=1 Tax=Microcoleus sp. D2_18a_D3 TaxID=3055330 RepID=UPI002FD1288C